MRRKILTTITTGSIFLIALTGCGGSSDNPVTSDAVITNNTTAYVAEIPDDSEGEITEEEIEEETETDKPEEPDTEAPVVENTKISDTENTDTETSNQEVVTAETPNTEVPVVENTETAENTETIKPSSNTSASNSWGTLQEYYGDPEGRGPGRIIVKGFDYNDFANGLSWEGEYWTASNGVEIKILSVEGRSTGMMPVPDGKGKDNEPNSPFQVAVAEALGWDYSKYNADLNVSIPLASYKRTEIDINDADLVAYRDAYDYKLWVNSGVAAYYTPYEYGVTPFINLRFAVASDGISEFDSVGGIFWSVIRMGDYWQVEINANLTELRWDGIHQVLRYLSPDGDALYDVIYEDYYVGSPAILEYEEWFAVGNSQIYQEDPTTGYVIYRFK